MKMEEQTQTKEPAYRLNVKKNFKGEMGWEGTVREDDIDNIKTMMNELKAYADNICLKT